MPNVHLRDQELHACSFLEYLLTNETASVLVYSIMAQNHGLTL